MPGDTFTIAQNDTKKDLVRTLENADGSAIDLTGAVVRFHMKKGGAVKVDAAVSVTDAANGIVTYLWQAADTDTPGTYKAEFEITFSGGGILTVPNDQKMVVNIVRELN